MGNNKTPYKTNFERSGKTATSKQVRKTKRRNIAKPWAIRATRVDESAEKVQRIKWFLKWVLLLPLSVYAVIWLALLMFDLFSA